MSNVQLIGNNLTFTGVGNAFNSTVDLSSLGGGGADYVSNVTFDGANLNFTGVGSGFNGPVDISSVNTDTNNFHTSMTFNPTTNVLDLTSSNGAPALSVDLSDLQDTFVDTNDYVDGITVTGTTTKTIRLTRTGVLPDLTATFTDNNANNYISNVQLIGDALVFSKVGSAFSGSISLAQFADTTIYTNNGTLLSNRTVSGGGYSLTFTGTSTSTLTSNSLTTVSSNSAVSVSSGIGGTGISSSSVISLNAPNVNVNQGQISLFSGANAITVKSPGVLGSSYTLTLPTTDGNPNEVLITDGSGNLSWDTFPDLNGIYSGSGNLQSGTTTVTGTGSDTLQFASMNNFYAYPASAFIASAPSATMQTNSGNEQIGVTTGLINMAANSFEIQASYTNNTTSATMRFNEAYSNGSSYVGLKSPNALSASYTLTLPTTAGSSGQFLTTDGSGNLYWSTSSGGMTSFTVFGDSGSIETITNGNTLLIKGSNNPVTGAPNITTVSSATDKVTINWSATLNDLSDVTAPPTLGDMLYWNGTAWVDLSIGTTGKVLTSTGSVPTWGDKMKWTVDGDTNIAANGGIVDDGNTVVFAGGDLLTTFVNGIADLNSVSINIDTTGATAGDTITYTGSGLTWSKPLDGLFTPSITYVTGCTARTSGGSNRMIYSVNRTSHGTGEIVTVHGQVGVDIDQTTPGSVYLEIRVELPISSNLNDIVQHVQGMASFQCETNTSDTGTGSWAAPQGHCFADTVNDEIVIRIRTRPDSNTVIYKDSENTGERNIVYSLQYIVL